MKKLLLFIVIVTITLTSCAITHSCPSHDKGYFYRANGIKPFKQSKAAKNNQCNVPSNKY